MDTSSWRGDYLSTGTNLPSPSFFQKLYLQCISC